MLQILKLLVLFGFIACCSCRTRNQPVIDSGYIDSLVAHKQLSAAEKAITADVSFWENRLSMSPGAYTAGTRLAGALVQRFHLYGDIDDLVTADSLLCSLSAAANGREAGILRSLATLNITRHRFKAADSLARGALSIGAEKYASSLLLFDTEFELGDKTVASRILASCAATNEFGYFFRLARWKHLLGESDSAVFYLEKAKQWSGSSASLKQAALSNMGDLYQHEGKMDKAATAYRQSLAIDAGDWRSLQGLGRIALLYDRQPALAEKIFGLIAAQNELPDAQYNLLWFAEQQSDSLRTKDAALVFARKASQPVYGGMYNKYLVECYTGILRSPQDALRLAERELANRSTPQTNAWYAWCLHCVGQDEKAEQVYRSQVAGKPLETLELYWMGKMMQDMNKRYLATQFFKAADRNRSDLSPAKQQDLKTYL